MQSQETEIGEFLSTFTKQRHTVLSRAAGILNPVTSQQAAPVEAVPQLSALLATSLEELKVCEEELLTQHESFLSQRDEAEQKLQHYRELFDLAPVAILMTDLNGSVREANRTACRILERSAYHLDRKPLAAIVPRAERALFRQGLARLTLIKHVSHWRFCLERPTNSPIDVVATVDVVRSSRLGGNALLWSLQAVESTNE